MQINGDKLHFDMRRPCATCPFRRDVDPALHIEHIDTIRLREIADDLPKIPWACHSTTDKLDEGGEACNERTQQCPGQLILLERQGTPHGLRAFLLSASDELGIPIAELDMSAPVYDSLAEMWRAYFIAQAKELGLA